MKTMKYLVVLYDGMADYPVPALGNKTPMELAKKPNFDALAQKGEVGLVKTVQDGMKPGSDVANLSVMGYDAKKYYTGRSPLEAVSMGIEMMPDENVIVVYDRGTIDNTAYINKEEFDIKVVIIGNIVGNHVCRETNS